jgi:hypothetical protein
MQTIADYYRSQGARRALKRGLAKGLEQGRVEGPGRACAGPGAGLRGALERLLTRRFKKIPRA